MLSQSFGGRTKYLGWGVNPSVPQTLHFVQGDNRKTLATGKTMVDLRRSREYAYL